MSKLLPLDLYIRQGLIYPLTSPFLPPINKVEKDFSYAAGKRTGTLEAGGGYGLPKTGQTIKVVDYDDGYYQKGYPLTGDHFTDNGDGTITDNATGLMWVKDATGDGCNGGAGLAWANAITFAEGLTFATHSDWRLPNINELLSIVDYGQSDPTINPIFTHTITDRYWSSTQDIYGGDYFYNVRFSNASSATAYTTNEYYIRPVRDA